MKNIHLLPTDKPSRLMIDTIENKLYLQPILHEKTINVLPQHIHITSDEEIKEGDWCLCSEELVHKVVEIKSNIGIIRFQDGVTEVLNACKKIILTTDQELIEEGIQAIDDEFLEWFVKNPSCEKVEVEHFGTCCGNQSITQCINCKKYNPVYRIIIPQEEPKQETLEEYSNGLYKQSLKDDVDLTFSDGAKLGAKWQAERMYSEEELKNAIEISVAKALGVMSFTINEESFEQFKNK
jgi:hypothetical protein